MSGRTDRYCGKFEFDDRMRIDAPGGAAGFDRLELTYTSSCALRLGLEFGNGETDELYLSASPEPLTAGFLMKGYQAGRLSEGLPAVTFTALEGRRCRLEVSDFSVSVREPLSCDTAYIENEKYRVGAYLRWGGGLSCLEDKTFAVSEYRNLLNRYDTGRLVQQSYYGTSQPPYVTGEFMGNVWPYNPVQGGDRGNNRSRLIDFSVSAGEIFVKCQPRDWGHDGSITPSYMENRYSLEGGAVRVDNAFTDFSGYDNPCASQELPAFYVVSGLDRFVCYQGGSPWTGGELTFQDGLPFWAGGAPECYTSFAPDNTENWCAWVNRDGYGAGLYVPSAELMVKGRFSYDGSYDPMAPSTNYVAPLRKLRLLPYRTLRYSYFIAAGQLEDIRSEFARRRGSVSNRELDVFDPRSEIYGG